MIIPVVLATLKSFLRSRRTLFILFVLPIMLILFIFLSFSPHGLAPVPAGITINSGISFEEARDAFDWLDLSQYPSFDDCLRAIRSGDTYVCMNVYGTEQVTFEVFFDNTREPVIWEVVTRIEQTLRGFERARTSEAADELFGSLSEVDSYLGSIADSSRDQMDRLSSAQSEIVVLRSDLSRSRSELSMMLTEMDRDVARARSESASMRSEHRRTVDDIRADLLRIEQQVAIIGSAANISVLQAQSVIDDAKRDLDEYDERMLSRIDTLDAQILSYESRSVQGSQMLAAMGGQDEQLSGFITEIASMNAELDELSRSASDTSGSLEVLIDSGSVSLLESVSLMNIPTYVPQVDVPLESDADGLSVLTLQTMFPALLMLVVLFFGILLSTFMMLTHVTTPAHVRLRLVEGSWYKDYFAMVISSGIISSIMVALVLGFGVYLFRIPVENIMPYAAVLFLILMVLSLIGIFVVHAVWSESMSVIVAMFMLVAILFSSGFILPIERMSSWAVSLSQINPVSIGLSAFDRVVFYSGTVPSGDWIILIGWVFSLVIATLIIRLMREL